MPLAEVTCCCGRLVLYVGGVAVAMEGDPCRQQLPVDVMELIPKEELETATIGGKPCKDMPLEVIQFFRGENWSGKSLEWAAAKINKASTFKFPDIADVIRSDADNFLFKADVNEEEYRQYARDNAPPDTWEQVCVMHPYCRDEWYKRGVCPLPSPQSPLQEAPGEDPKTGG